MQQYLDFKHIKIIQIKFKTINYKILKIYKTISTRKEAVVFIHVLSSGIYLCSKQWYLSMF